jgi:hypothetical protein
MRDNTYIKNYADKAAKLIQREMDAIERIYDIADAIHNTPYLQDMKVIDKTNVYNKTPLKKDEFPYDPVKAKELNDWLQSQMGLN